jgi:tetratricopeptide (TPR) repeat protein
LPSLPIASIVWIIGQRNPGMAKKTNMKKIISWQLVFLLFFALKTYAQIKDNPELQKMYDEDQAARMVANINWVVLSKQDSIRQARVYELLKENKVITGKDHYNSAMIFQHGNDSISSAMAVKQMKKAIEIDSTINKWLLAAAIDRDLMRRNQPQIYGTQYVMIGQNAKWERYKIDSTKITDEERRYYKVETLAEQRVKERNLNLSSVSTYHAKSNSIDETIKFIQSEKGKGDQSAYNLSERAINSFGYELMNANKTLEVLKVFKLNTELYPDGFNTFDSYGECLLKLNRKEEAVKAYKKSLDLNPQNENARKVMSENK